MKKAFIIAFCCLFILLPRLGEAQNAAVDLSILEGEKHSLLEELSRLEEQIEAYEGELTKKQGEITSLNNQIGIINARINKLNTEIKKTKNLVAITRLDIQKTQVAIDEATAAIDKNKATLAELLRAFHQLEGETVIERLLKYDNLSQVLSETQYLESLQARLTVVLDETRASKRLLESNEIVLKDKKQDLEEKNRELAVQESAEKGERAHKNTILSETREQEQRYQQLLSAAEEEQAEFMKRLAEIEQQILIQQNFVAYFKAGEIPKPGTKIFVSPQDNYVLTQPYGLTAYARRGAYGGKGHNGIDIKAGLASPVKAAAGGKVAAKGAQSCTNYVQRSCNGYWGNWVAIEHPGGLVTLYAHLTKPSHKGIGEAVAVGEVIGYEGATGGVTGPHLHFSVYTEFFTYRDPKTGDIRFSYNYEKTLNPLDYL